MADIKRVTNTDGTLSATLMEEIGRLRVIAWEADGERPSYLVDGEDCWTDHHDDHADHFVLIKDRKVVAASRLCVHRLDDVLPDQPTIGDAASKLPQPVAFINRLVVHPSNRRQGIAAEMDELRISWARDRGCRTILATTHLGRRLSQLQRSGFEILGPGKTDFVSYARTMVLALNLSQRDG
jgi:GNAT superfamily N-acetyltransferase